jgi:hypothetical protein
MLSETLFKTASSKVSTDAIIDVIKERNSTQHSACARNTKGGTKQAQAAL